jgi:hypothetical protein
MLWRREKSFSSRESNYGRPACGQSLYRLSYKKHSSFVRVIIHKIDITNKRFNYFSAPCFKGNCRKEQALLLVLSIPACVTASHARSLCQNSGKKSKALVNKAES